MLKQKYVIFVISSTIYPLPYTKQLAILVLSNLANYIMEIFINTINRINMDLTFRKLRYTFDFTSTGMMF